MTFDTAKEYIELQEQLRVHDIFVKNMDLSAKQVVDFEEQRKTIVNKLNKIEKELTDL